MRTLLSSVCICALIVALTGCIALRAPVQPPSAILYTNTTAPLDADHNQTDTDTPRTGKSECSWILGLVAWGDASTEAAARNGQVGTIEYADYEYFNVLWVYQRYTTVVHGK